MQYAAALSYHKTPDACLVDSTAPTFAGIASMVSNGNGSFSVGWLAATDANGPIRYKIYCKQADNTDLFNETNLVFITEDLDARVFEDGLGNLLTQDTTYFIGVRAMDALGNLDQNTVSLSEVSSGVLTDALAEVAQDLIDASNKIKYSLGLDSAKVKFEDDTIDIKSNDEKINVGIE